VLLLVLLALLAAGEVSAVVSRRRGSADTRHAGRLRAGTAVPRSTRRRS
jgi:hypothetical protein